MVIIIKKMCVQDYVNTVCTVCGSCVGQKSSLPLPKIVLCGLTSVFYSSIILSVVH